jgi:phosphoglycolate phosphatase
VLDCLAKAFTWFGLEHAPFDSSKILQFQLRDAVRAALPGITPEKTELVAGRFREIYDASDYPATRLMDTVDRLLPELSKRGKALFIVTNKRRTPTVRIMEKFNIGRFFTGVFNPDMPGDRSTMTKGELLARAVETYSLEKATTAYVGDMETDMAAAKENGVLAIAVQNGYGDTASFNVKPDYTARAITEILAF